MTSHATESVFPGKPACNKSSLTYLLTYLEEYPAMPGMGFARATSGPKAFEGHIVEMKSLFLKKS